MRPVVSGLKLMQTDFRGPTSIIWVQWRCCVPGIPDMHIVKCVMVCRDILALQHLQGHEMQLKYFSTSVNELAADNGLLPVTFNWP